MPKASTKGKFGISMLKFIGLGRLVTGIVGSNPTRGMDVCLCVSMLCCPV
jgi:hypothetical protein